MKKIFFATIFLAATQIYSMNSKIKTAHTAPILINDTPTKPALYLAASNGNKDLLKSLITKGGDIREIDSQGKSLLHLAAQSGNVSIVKFLLKKGLSPNMVDKSNITPLHEAAYYHRLEAVKLLVEYGAHINTRNAFARTPLHDAATRQSGWEVVSDNWTAVVNFLLSKGAEIDCIDFDDETPLDKAIQAGNPPVVELLLSAKANPKRASKKASITPLHRAAYRKDLEIVRSLLKYGASVHAQNCWHRTALHDVAASPMIISCKELIPLLLQHGADINCVDVEGETPLFKAVDNKDDETVKFLLEHNAQPNIARKGLITPLHHAARHAERSTVEKSKSIILSLICHGAKVNALNDGAKTPLHDAAENGNQEIIDLLINNGADATLKDIDGKKPLETIKQIFHGTITDMVTRYTYQNPTISPQTNVDHAAATTTDEMLFDLELPH